MKEEWKKVKLGEISADIQTGPFGSQLHMSDYSEKGIPVVMPKDMINGKITEENIARVTDNHVKRLNRYIISSGNILYARRGDVGKCVYVSEKESGWLCGTGCLRININTAIANPKFVFFQLQKTETIGWVEKNAVGATMLNLNTSILANVPLHLPPLPTQQKIASILSAYDDLIENNRKQIKLLEEAALKLYKEWFVKLNFPGHETTKIADGVPDGWKKEKVGNLISTLSKTKQIKTSEIKKTGKIPVIDQSRDFIAGYTDDLESLISPKKPVIVFGDHTRILKLIQFPFARGADGTQTFISINENIQEYQLFCALIEIDLSSYSYARHFKYLKEELVFVPTKEISNRFESFATSSYKMIQKLRDQIQLLQSARDKLLPKLMNGEIEV